MKSEYNALSEDGIISFCYHTILVTSILSSYLSLLLIYYYSKVQKRRKNYIDFTCSFIMNFLKLLMNITLCLECFVSPKGVFILICEVSNFIQIIVIILSLHFCQVWNRKIFLPLAVISSTVCTAARLVQVCHLVKHGINISYVVLLVVLADIGLTILLIIPYVTLYSQMCDVSSVPNFWLVLKKPLLLSGLLKLVGDVLAIIPSLCVSGIIEYVSTNQQSSDSMLQSNSGHSAFARWDAFLRNGYVIVVFQLMALSAQGIISQLSSNIITVGGIRFQSVLQVLLYRKSLKIHYAAEPVEDECLGNPENILIGDTNNVMSFIWNIHYLWAIPFKVALIIFLLYIKLGTSAVYGTIGAILLLLPGQLFVMKKMSSISSVLMEATDKRLKRIVDFLTYVKTVKLQASECLVENQIKSARDSELKILNRDSFYWAILSFLTQATPVLIGIMAFGVYNFGEGTPLKAETIFTSLALITQLMVPLALFPITLSMLISAKKSSERISKYLNGPEVVKVYAPKKTESLESIPEKEERHPTRKQSDRLGLPLENIMEEDTSSETYQAHSVDVIHEKAAFRLVGVSLGSPPVLDGIDLNIYCGKLTLVLGSVSSGKSTLLAALLGDIQPSGGKIYFEEKTLALVAQKPWTMTGSIRDNILFGHSYRQKRYEKVLNACCLEEDISSMSEEDETWVTSNGENLSGGQRQRISIARAIYSNADVVILDDPFSALDPQVAQKILNEGLINLLIRRGKTVILATSNTALAQHAHQVILLKEGKVTTASNVSSLNEWQSAPSKKESIAEAKYPSIEPATLNNLHSHLKRRRSIKMATSMHFALHESYIFDEYHVLKTEEEEDRAVFLQTEKRKAFRTYSAGAVPTFSGSRSNFLKRESVFSHRSEMVSSSLKKLASPYTTVIPDARKTERPFRRPSLLAHFTKGRNSRRVSSTSVRSKDGSLKSKPKYPLTRLTSNVSGFSDDGSIYDSEAGMLTLSSTDEEQKSHGSLKRSTYGIYLASGSVVLGTSFLLLSLLSQVLRVYIDYSLSWSYNSNKNNASNYYVELDDVADQQESSHLRSYFLCSAAFVFISFMANVIGQIFGAISRRKIHSRLLSTLMQCRMDFFEATPSGRILNRFSADIAIVDKKIALGIQRLLQFSLLCIACVVVNAFVSLWTVLLSSIIILFYYWLQRTYRKTARELQRIESVSKSPVIGHFMETIDGSAIIRTFDVEEKFQNEFHKKLDSNIHAALLQNAGNRWLGVTLDLLGSIIVFISAVSCLLMNQIFPGSLTEAQIGVALNSTLVVPIFLTWIVRFTSECEANMGSVERIQMFLDVPETIKHRYCANIRSSWPERGEISFHDLTVYQGSNAEATLKNITLQIKPGEKIGICGRTGSGKTTLLLSILNMVTEMEGTIFIDNIDIQRISTNVLRRNICLAEQELFFVLPTLREFLDPEKSLSDDEMFSTLELVWMKESVHRHPKGLGMDMGSNEASFSIGQLQLLSIARVLLSKCKIIILDEVTSSLDIDCEVHILNILKEKLKDKTVIMVAHRPTTLLACNRVLVVDKGRIIEDADPQDLRHRPNSHFFSLMKLQ
ncbi:ATP-binding cassette sub-family C member Sur-like isoform X2 [Artemia franciscana]|uniref:ATP-binding cassette sub-family C member Sur-like isoform X2 n=1 Tax=Artemia franciscana TaxID=6661 RepID=UPI0032DBF246